MNCEQLMFSLLEFSDFTIEIRKSVYCVLDFEGCILFRGKDIFSTLKFLLDYLHNNLDSFWLEQRCLYE